VIDVMQIAAGCSKYYVPKTTQLSKDTLL